MGTKSNPVSKLTFKRYNNISDFGLIGTKNEPICQI